MHNQTWGLPVQNLLTRHGIACWQSSTATHSTRTTTWLGSGNTRLSHMFSRVFLVRYQQATSSNLYLLLAYFIHLSTLPITMTKKKGFKK